MIKFKTPRQEQDYTTLLTQNYPLARLISAAEIFCELEFNKDIVLTDIYRTRAEFDALYAATPVDKRPTDSPHCHWQGVDLRSSVYTDVEIKRLLAFLNSFKNPNGKVTALYHTIAGNVAHFHTQFRLQ